MPRNSAAIIGLKWFTQRRTVSYDTLIFSLGCNGWFTEGFDTLDLRDAKALLDDLHV